MGYFDLPVTLKTTNKVYFEPATSHREASSSEREKMHRKERAGTRVWTFFWLVLGQGKRRFLWRLGSEPFSSAGSTVRSRETPLYCSLLQESNREREAETSSASAHLQSGLSLLQRAPLGVAFRARRRRCGRACWPFLFSFFLLADAWLPAS